VRRGLSVGERGDDQANCEANYIFAEITDEVIVADFLMLEELISKINQRE